MSQGYIGYHLQKGIAKELRRQKMPWQVATVVTQVVVDPADEAFKRPTKPIGAFYDEETAKAVEEYGSDAAEFEESDLHTFIVPKGYHWSDVRNCAENVGKAITDAFHKVEMANSEKLQGVFGDGSWTNKNRLPDRLLKDLMEHFSSQTLSICQSASCGAPSRM